ncbi:hypothetical protein [Sulfurimonas sp.]
MKKIFLVVLFSTMLFAGQKQIILGSYLEEKNAVDGVEKLKEHIEDSDKLSWLKKIGAIEAKYKKVGKYFVVYLMPEDRKQLFRAYAGVKRYYNDAYAIEYSASGASSKIDMSGSEKEEIAVSEKIEENNEEEMVVLEDNIAGMSAAAEEKVQKIEKQIETIENENEYASDEDMQKMQADMEIIDEEAYAAAKKDVASLKEDIEIIEDSEAQKMEEIAEDVEPLKVESTKLKEEVKEKVEPTMLEKANNYLLEILLVILVIIAVIYIIYKNRRKNDEEKQEIQEIKLEEK